VHDTWHTPHENGDAIPMNRPVPMMSVLQLAQLALAILWFLICHRALIMVGFFSSHVIPVARLKVAHLFH
jgi:hypothetical protein